VRQPNIDYCKLARYKGKTLLAKEILEICGYSPKTGINDTFLAQNKIIKRIQGTYPARWVVSQDWGIFGL